MEENAELLFCENETNDARLYGGAPQGYYKDAFHEYLVHGNLSAVNPLLRGTKACAHLTAHVDAGGSANGSACASLTLRIPRPLSEFEQIASAQHP